MATKRKGKGPSGVSRHQLPRFTPPVVNDSGVPGQHYCADCANCKAWEKILRQHWADFHKGNRV